MTTLVDDRQRHHHVPSSRGRHPADPHPGWAAAPPTRQAPRRQGLRQRGQPGLAAASWDPATDRPAWSGVLDAAGAASLEGGAVAVLVELLAAAWCAVGPGCRPVVRVRAAGLVRSFASTGCDQPAGVSCPGRCWCARLGLWRRYAGVGTTPSCCINASLSNCSQCSAILPPARRKMLIPPIRTCLPVAGTPSSSPRCVPA